MEGQFPTGIMNGIECCIVNALASSPQLQMERLLWVQLLTCLSSVHLSSPYVT